MTNFQWQQHFQLNQDPNLQVKTFTEIFRNIMSNFIRNETTKVAPRDLPWITRQLKTMLKKKDKRQKTKGTDKRQKKKDKRHGQKTKDKRHGQKKKDKRHGHQPHDKVRLNNFRKECLETIESSKLKYIRNLGNKLADPKTSQ